MQNMQTRSLDLKNIFWDHGKSLDLIFFWFEVDTLNIKKCKKSTF